jgi:hypothetical protein
LFGLSQFLADQFVGNSLSFLPRLLLAFGALLALGFKISLRFSLNSRLVDRVFLVELGGDSQRLLMLSRRDPAGDFFDLIGRNFLTARGTIVKAKMQVRSGIS